MVVNSNARRSRKVASALGRIEDRRREAERFGEKIRRSYMHRVNHFEDPIPIHMHSFRDRRVDREVGPENGHISGKIYVPRAYYRGGGVVDREKTVAMRDVCGPVDCLDPRPATASIVDGGLICGRLARTLYSQNSSNGWLRQREKHKEMQPPMRFKAQTEAERVSDSITMNSIQDAGES